MLFQEQLSADGGRTCCDRIERENKAKNKWIRRIGEGKRHRKGSRGPKKRLL